MQELSSIIKQAWKQNDSVSRALGFILFLNLPLKLQGQLKTIVNLWAECRKIYFVPLKVSQNSWRVRGLYISISFIITIIHYYYHHHFSIEMWFSQILLKKYGTADTEWPQNLIDSRGNRNLESPLHPLTLVSPITVDEEMSRQNDLEERQSSETAQLHPYNIQLRIYVAVRVCWCETGAHSAGW